MVDKHILYITEELNLNYMKSTGDEALVPFVYFDTGHIYGIKFMGDCIWDSENGPMYHDVEDRELTRVELRRSIVNSIGVIIDGLYTFKNSIVR